MPNIPLINSTSCATVDAADVERLKEFVWWEHKVTDTLSYAYGTKLPRKRKGEQVVKMHRFILGLTKTDPHVDHIDGNGLNNCQNNLRLVSVAQNIQKANFDPAKNKRKRHSKYRGVSYLEWHGRYLAYVNCDGRREYLGYFDTEEEAARARDVRAKELHGEFVRLNFANN